MSDIPEGWYPDPSDSRRVRHWNGTSWSEHTAPVNPKDAKSLKANRAKTAREAEQARKREEADEARRVKAEKQEAIRASEARAAAHYAQQEAELAAERAAEEAAYWSGVSIVGNLLSAKAAQAIRTHSAPDEKPWFVLVPYGFAGVLAAWDDRLMIIKTGAITGFMAGTLGGGRITTFPFVEVTGIEFNGQLLTGVLEVLTASYQGSANKDYWRGTTKSRNADANDPYTLSNTLPIAKALYNQAQPQLNELRRRVVASKTQRVVVETPNMAASPVSIADELVKLAHLRDSGVLSDEEFAAAKAKLLGG